VIDCSAARARSTVGLIQVLAKCGLAKLILRTRATCMLARQRSREWYMRTNLRVSEQRGDTHTGSNHPHLKETRDNAKRGRHRRSGTPQRHRAASFQPESGPARSDFHRSEAGQPRGSERFHWKSSVPEPAATAERDCGVLPNLRRMSVVVRLSSVRLCHPVRAFRR